MESVTSIGLFSDDIPYSSPPPEGAPILAITVPTTSTSLRIPRLPFSSDTATTSLTKYLGFPPYATQVSALEYLYRGKDHILVAPCGWGKTIVITGLACILPTPEKTITLIISPLRSIQLNQATSLQQEIGEVFRPFVLDGDTNTQGNRHLIATGHFTHVWISAEIAISDVNTQKERRKSTRLPDKALFRETGYEDTGTFNSVLLHQTCMLYPI